MFLLKRTVALFLFLAIAACGRAEDVSVVQTTSSEAGVKPMLPAWPEAGERNGAAKADQYDDYRWSLPATYGITAAPKTPMRTVAQYDGHQKLLLGWTGSFPKTNADIVKAAKPVADVIVFHEGQASKQGFQSALSQYGVSLDGIQYINTNLDSLWMRDYGPLSVRAPDGTVSFVDPKYYGNRVYDDAIPTKLALTLGINVYRQPLAWEGGTYITDGFGNCYYTQGVYWYGGVSQDMVHKYQHDYLGCETNIILKPLVQEGTTHSDMFAKLVSKNSMVLGKYTTGQDATNKKTLDDNDAILKAAVLNDGSKLAVTRIPMGSNSNKQVWRTYANSLLINGKNLVPVYADDTTYQAEALAVWKQVLPNHTHVSIDSTELIGWGGAIHCITMTVPDGALAKAEATPGFLCDGDFSCTPTQTGGDTCPIDFEGCCDGATLHSCKNGAESTTACTGGCGFSGDVNAYACGASGDGPANAPKACGAVCVPSCGGNACGPNGCGGSCGTCPAGSTCSGGQCGTPTDGCGGVSYEGCCESNTLKYCDSGTLNVQPCQKCGWNLGSGWYDCGFSGSDPSGKFPKACPSTCQPSCTGKTCGDDGCGGSCGSCAAGQACTAGKCVCQPSCAGKKCGSDGCGGSCGTCAAGQTCSTAGQCIAPCAPACTGKACGADGCGGSCGSCAGGQTCTAAGQCESPAGCGDVSFAGKCEGNTLVWCQDAKIQKFDCTKLGGSFTCGADPGTSPPNYNCVPGSPTCTPSCAGKTCGPDGCGGVCGNCDAALVCMAGTCQPQATDPCGGLTYEGCCETSTLNWCEGGKKKAINCGGGGCGWNAAGNGGAGYYDCNAQGADPSGKNPLACGGTACTPACAGKVCGDDGCGGACGTCTGGTTCEAGKCVSGQQPGDACGDVTWEGSCGGTALSFCNNGALSTFDCATAGGCCGWVADELYYDCVECGAPCVDECATGETGCSQKGTHAWTCGAGSGGCLVRQWTACVNGACDVAAKACPGGPTCTPGCDGKKCGDDGCGGSCGLCAAGESCNASNQCVAGCTPSCAGKQCGSDGCGGDCGACAAGETCKAGACASTSCQPKCGGKVCGDDGCGGSCGACSGDQTCDKFGQCNAAPPVCTPACDGKQCGPDGCGGACGVCAKESTCKDGECIANPDAGCGGVSKAGECDGDTLKVCGDDGKLTSLNCAAQGLVCGAGMGGGYDCVEPGGCLPTCNGKTCGDDGCGGTCGACPKNFECKSSQCVSTACVPQCDGKQCGPDFCGGTCGACGEGTACDQLTGQCKAESVCSDGSAPVAGKCPAVTPPPTGNGDGDGTGDATGGSSSGCAQAAAPGAGNRAIPGGSLLGFGFAVMVFFLRRRRVTS